MDNSSCDSALLPSIGTRRQRSRSRDHCMRLLLEMVHQWLFFRIYGNEDDTTFSPVELNFFDDEANRYNLLERRERAGENFKCLDLYFAANSDILMGRIESAEMHVRKGFKTAKRGVKTSLYYLLLASPLARIYHMRRDIQALQDHLDICFQIIDTSGRTMPGSILGWLFYMKARAETNTAEVIRYFKRAIDAFEISETQDKDFGTGHALCRLAIAILGCGEEADTVDSVVTPTPSKLREVKGYFERLEEMEIEQCIVIKILFLMAKSDYYTRTLNPVEALKNAEHAHKMAVKWQCLEFVEVTKKRKEVYAAKVPEEEKQPKHMGDIIIRRPTNCAIAFGESAQAKQVFND